MESNRKKRAIFSDYVVAYLDVLGQKEKLNKLRKLPTTEQENKEFKDTAIQTYVVVRNLREWLKGSIEWSRSVTYGLIIDGALEITEPQETHMRSLVESDYQFSFFSDSIAVTSPYYDSNGTPLIQNVFGLLLSLSAAMITSLAKRAPVRGSVEVGKGFGWPDGGVYGPIMSDVYELESQIALYPRIVIGNKLNNYICDCVKKSKDKSIPHVEDNIWQSIIYTDKDGMPTLDYLGQAFFQITESLLHIKENVRLGWEFVGSEYERFKSCQEPQMALKYSLLREYYLSRLEIWDIK